MVSRAAMNRSVQTIETSDAGEIISDHLAVEGFLEYDEVARAVLGQCSDCIEVLDLEGRLQFMSDGAKRVMEVDDFSKLKGRSWSDSWIDAGKILAKEAVESARRGKTAHF